MAMFKGFAGLTLIAMLATFGARAADLPTMKAASARAVAPIEPLGFFVRLGAIYAINSSSSTFTAAARPGGPQGPVPGAGADIGNVATVGAQFGYFITPEISVDIATGVPMWAHDTIKNSPLAAAPSGTILAKVKPSAVPLTVNYHFMGLGVFQPYVGVGLAPVFSFSTHDAFITSVVVNPSIGAVVEAGADVMIDRHWGVAFDVKKIFANVTATGTGFSVAPGVPFASTQKISFQPWILATGVTYRF